MNEKLLELVKEAGFNVSLGEITIIHMNRHINVNCQVKKLIELVQAKCGPTTKNTELLSAAKEVIERWDSPLMKDLPSTGEAINRLRKAIEGIE